MFVRAEYITVASMFIAIAIMAASFLRWHNENPKKRENELLHRIFELEKEVENFSACMDELKHLKETVEFLRTENRSLILAMGRVQKVPGSNQRARDELQTLEQRLIIKRENLRSLELELATYREDCAPFHLIEAVRNEKGAIASIEQLIDLLHETEPPHWPK